MTSQTKQYIELSDIVALRIECSNCKISISLPLSEKIETKKLGYCPHCEAWWAATPCEPDVTMLPAIQDYLRSVEALKRFFQPESKFVGRFALSLEIAPDSATRN